MQLSISSFRSSSSPHKTFRFLTPQEMVTGGGDGFTQWKTEVRVPILAREGRQLGEDNKGGVSA